MDIMRTWDITYHPNGHRYTLYEKMSKKSAQDMFLRLTKHDNLVIALKDAEGTEQQAQLWEERLQAAKEIAKLGSLVFRRCLGLTQEQIDEMDTQECIEILVKILRFSIED